MTTLEERVKENPDLDARPEIERIRNELVLLRNAALVEAEMTVAVYLSHAIRPLSLLLNEDESHVTCDVSDSTS